VCALASSTLAAATVAGILLADHGSWDPVLFGVLLALIIGAGFVEIELGGFTISGEALGLVVAAALLGPTQAAVLGVVYGLIWITRGPTRLPTGLAFVAERATIGITGGITVAWVADLMGTTPEDLAFALPVLACFTVFVVLNAAIQFGVGKVLDDDPFWESIKTIIVPLLPSDAVMVLLAAITVFAEANLGPFALALLVALFFLYIHLYKQLVLSEKRGEELERRTEQLASLQVGVLTAMLRTLSMRDQMTARHSAAVARYTRAIAKAAGCSDEEQDLAHTAGLLHDIGKFILPDHILLADSKLDDDDWQLIRMHPYQGAKVVREVEGYGPIADIIWCHHERIDGRGYPRGIAGDDIPLISRMISIADTYDVMTSRDSYRSPVSSAEAIAELRRVSGAQLDGRLVEIFVTVLETEGVAFQHTDDTDFEVELAFERRVRDYAAPRPALKAA
jgi:putative nucleotidyltransferase with HDIG domain